MVAVNIDEGAIRPGRGSEISRRLPQLRQRIVGIDHSFLVQCGKDGLLAVACDYGVESSEKRGKGPFGAMIPSNSGRMYQGGMRSAKDRTSAKNCP